VPQGLGGIFILPRWNGQKIKKGGGVHELG